MLFLLHLMIVLCLKLSSALAAELSSRLVLIAAVRTDACRLRCRSRSHRSSAVIAELHALCVLRSAAFASVERHGCSTVVTELAVSCRFAAYRTDCSLALDLALPYCCGLSRFIYISLHRFSSRLGYVDFLSRSALSTEAFVFVVTGIAYILVTSVTSVEVLSGFILCSFECHLVFLLPLRASALETFTEDVCHSVSSPRHVAQIAADHAADN